MSPNVSEKYWQKWLMWPMCCCSLGKLFFNDQPMLGEIEMRLTKQKKSLKGVTFRWSVNSKEWRKRAKNKKTTSLLSDFFISHPLLYRVLGNKSSTFYDTECIIQGVEK